MLAVIFAFAKHSKLSHLISPTTTIAYSDTECQDNNYIMPNLFFHAA
jgi:hypothetical protein